MITEHWTNHILRNNIDDDEYVSILCENILCTDPLDHHATPTEKLIDEFYEDRPIFDRLKRYMYENINEYINKVYDLTDLDYHVRTFLVTNNIHTRTNFHNHKCAFLSGVFYINVDENSGELLFHDPRFNAVRSTPIECSKAFAPVIMSPKNGDIVIFPSFVYHETNISFSNIPRILIPFDVYIKT